MYLEIFLLANLISRKLFYNHKHILTKNFSQNFLSSKPVFEEIIVLQKKIRPKIYQKMFLQTCFPLNDFATYRTFTTKNVF